MNETETAAKASDNLLGDLMRLQIDNAKAMPKPWQAMSEMEQQGWIETIKTQTTFAVNKAVDMISSRGLTVARCSLEQMVQKDGVKIQLSAPAMNDPLLTMCMYTANKPKVMLVLGELEDLLHENDLPQAEKDQTSMFEPDAYAPYGES